MSDRFGSCDSLARQSILTPPISAANMEPLPKPVVMKVESPSVSVVLLGRFRPDNFLPHKLADAKLIPPKVAESVSYTTLIPGIHVQFKFAWGDFMVVQDRFQISTSEAPYIRVCDFAVKAISDLGADATVTAFGINRDGHYDLGSIDARNDLGTRLAPPEAWGSWGQKLRQTMTGEAKGTAMQGGVIHIQMRHPFLDDGITGWLDITAAPSGVIADHRGVYFRANHHHQATPRASQGEVVAEKQSDIMVGEKPSDVTTRLLARLLDRFESSIAESESIFEGVLAS